MHNRQYSKDITLPNLIREKLCSISNIDSDNILTCKSRKNFEIKPNIHCVVNLEPMNNFRYINKMHEHVNQNIPNGCIYITCVETLDQREFNNKKTHFNFIAQFLLFFDFLFHRIFHKVPLLNKVYFLITKGSNRPLSKAEALGRVVSCGFYLKEVFKCNGLLCIISKKVSSPCYDLNASFSLIFKMRRVGFKGNLISVYKMRTMYPFSEYLQTYIIDENRLHKMGKINKDYRVTIWGRFFRKYWIDELPMLLNLIKGELGIVGVRPLSQDYFNRYPKDIQSLRILVKPGLIPPYYADLPRSFDEIIESERRYVLKKLKSPFLTDCKYLYKAVYNIIIKRERSS
jgi:lipopolysaccharide/colanic/teichoic acid biosynthesis glycosyltransferase